MRKLITMMALVLALLTACATAVAPDQGPNTEKIVTVYYSPT
ncbi:MAG: hypothetical protein ABFS17_10845 [Chloroflexota bacterium]